MKRSYLFLSALAICLACLSACKKWVEVPEPTNSVNAVNAYKSDIYAKEVINGIYTLWGSEDFNGNLSLPAQMCYIAGLSSDEYFYLTGAGDGGLPYYENKLLGSTSTNWASFYSQIQVTNAAIEGLTASQSLTLSVKQNLLGQAKFIRALYYFYLVNLYGEVPVITGTDYTVNRKAARLPVKAVYQQIEKDLKDAESLLSSTFVGYDGVTATTERTLPTTWAAKALLAKVYLYEADYKDAEAKASEVIANSSLFSLESLNNVFLKNNNEAIWQTQPINSGWNTQEARFFVLTGGLSQNHPVSLSTSLLNSFEVGDQRKVNWVGSFADQNSTPSTVYYYPYKYKVYNYGAPVTEYSTVLRLGEIYLIRAEARANLGEATALADLNAIRNRAGLANYAGATDQQSILTAIYHERQVELFSEWGNRWLDLKRTGRVDAVMSVAAPVKGSTWSSYQQWYPLPANDIRLDPNLRQNAGY